MNGGKGEVRGGGGGGESEGRVRVMVRVRGGPKSCKISQ